MIGITLTLLGKELRQHWLAFLALAGLCLLALGGIVAWLMRASQVASVFEPVRMFLMFGVPLTAAILCGRLVVAEYQAKTQLFLEALPVSRIHMVLVKFVFGLVALLAMVLTTLAVAAVAGRRHEAMTGQFALNLTVSAAAHALFWFTFFFTTGLLGRYRWPLMILLVCAVYAVSVGTAWDVSEFGPFKLLGDRFAFEREATPVQALREALLAAGGLAAVGFALALVREGNVSALLAERMSQREKVFVSVVLLTTVAVLGTVSAKTKHEPYRLPDAVEVVVRGVVVKVAGPEAKARPLAEFLAGEMAELREYLALDALPTVMITRRSDLDANKFERGKISNAEGFLVRLNYDAEEFDRGRFVAWLAGEVVNHRLHGRAGREPRRWVLDGFGEFWRRRARSSASLAEEPELALRALVGFGESGVDAGALAAWLTTRERVGEGVAAGMAWSGLRTIERARGAEACRDFLRSVLGRRLPQDVRAVWRDRGTVAARLRRAAGWTEKELIAAWNGELKVARAALADELAKVPRPELKLKLVAATPETVVVRYRVAFAPVVSSPTGEVEYRLRYLELPPLNEALEEDLLKDELHREALAKAGEHELPATFPRGGRLVVGAAVFAPALGCDVISGWRRVTVEGVER